MMGIIGLDLNESENDALLFDVFSIKKWWGLINQVLIIHKEDIINILEIMIQS